jgi:hypothetical protein
MGYEYYLRIDPAITDFEEPLRESLDHQYKIIISSILDQSSKQTIGIATDERLNTKWPHICDLLIENANLLYVLCHGKEGVLLMHNFIQHLQGLGYIVHTEDL